MNENREFLKFLSENKDNPSGTEIRIYDKKHNRVAYKELTVREYVLLNAAVEIEWKQLRRGEK